MFKQLKSYSYVTLNLLLPSYTSLFTLQSMKLKLANRLPIPAA